MFAIGRILYKERKIDQGIHEKTERQISQPPRTLGGRNIPEFFLDASDVTFRPSKTTGIQSGKMPACKAKKSPVPPGCSPASASTWADMLTTRPMAA